MPRSQLQPVARTGRPRRRLTSLVAGQYRALVKLIDVTVADGKLDLGFATEVNASQLAALQVIER
jgi:hypothetical protein